ncbi:unnamed protein product [Toxocara canis]|uniref:Elongator complex protein 1 n=1 Tax=Toxocara canis TaxID=6265 RepID=A0A183UF90_TOXCA|nr:unnamed protein product [Toxocara canis]
MEKNVRVSEVVRLPHSERINEKRDGATRKSLIDGVQRVCMEPINHTVYCATAERVFQLGAEEEVIYCFVPAIPRPESKDCVIADNPKIADELRSRCNGQTVVVQLAALTQQLILVNLHLQVWLDWSAERGNNEVVAFDFLYDDAKIFALLSNGMALLVDVLSKTIDVVIVLNDELCGGCWAPDVHVLVVASKHNIYFVSREFDIISEQLLNPLSAGQCELMSVGWGSKQTQFQGSTAARKQKSQVGSSVLLIMELFVIAKQNDVLQVEVDEETEVSALDSRRPLFSWSGDSQCVAVSFVEERGIRKTCLWSDEGELISRLQPLPFVEEALTYRCSQNVTVMCAVQNGIRKVVFFEHNGQMLSHYEIEKLSAERNRVIWMSWNASCDMLAIRIRSSTSFEEVQWWYLINGAFSLKYRLEFTDGLVDSWWNRTDPHWFYYLTHDGDCIALRFEFTYTFCDTTLFAIKGSKSGSVSPTQFINKNDFMQRCLKVDNILGRVCVTHLDKRVSPVCEEFVELPDTVCELAVYSGWVLFYLTSRFFVIYELVKGEPVERGIFDARGCHNDAPLFCLRYGGGNQLTAIDAHSKYRVVEITLDAGRAISRDIHESAQPLCYHVVTKKGLAVQTNLGDWMYVEEIDDRSCVEFSKQSFWKKQRIVDCCYNAEHDIVVGRNAGKALILNDRLVANGVESYSLGRRFLVYLSSSSALHSLQLHIYELNNDNVNGVGINSGRFVECGAAIIGHDEEGARIWLQMARGNIEEVNCRVMLLCKLKRMMDKLEYREVIEEMKRHRVDLNLIVDHNPSTFLSNLNTFIKVVNDAELLNQFVLSLNDEDTTVSRYSSSYKRPADYSACEYFLAANKVNTVCSRMRECLLALEECSLMVLYGVLLTAYLKSEPPGIAAALRDISSRAVKQEEHSKFERKWIEYVGMVMPRADLMRAALSLYDVPLALTAAQYSQQDPMEYLPALNQLQSYQPEAYQRYQIDMYLGRYDKALENLVHMDDAIEEAIALINRYHLFAKAISLFRRTKHYSRICREFAVHLRRKRIYDEATLLFRKGGDNKMAMECAEAAFLWRQVVELARELKLSAEESALRLSTIARHFESTGNQAVVADIMLVLCSLNTRSYDSKVEQDCVRITQLYCLAGDWDRAVQCSNNQSEALHWIDELGEKRYRELSEQIRIWEKQINEHSQRLVVVRREKKAMILASTSREEEGDNAQSEVSSDTSSTASGYSRMSTASRREKRVERKKMTLTKGSQYEDAGLLNALKSIISAVDKQQDELKGLLRALVVVDRIDESHQLQSHFSALIAIIRQQIPNIWPRYIEAHTITGPIHEIYRDEDGVVRLPSEGANLMPKRIHISSEMIPPNLRTNIFWKMQMWDENHC